MGEEVGAASSSPAQRGRGTIRQGVRKDARLSTGYGMVVGAGAPPMSVLLAVSGWDTAPWRERLASASALPQDRDAGRAVRSRVHPLRALLAPSAGRALRPSQPRGDLLAGRRRRSSLRRSRAARPPNRPRGRSRSHRPDERMGGHACARAPAPVAPLRAPAARANLGRRRRSAEGRRDRGRRARPGRAGQGRRDQARRARLQCRRLERERKVAQRRRLLPWGRAASTACWR